MPNAADRFEQWGAEFAGDPEYITHGLLGALTDDICAAMEAQKLTRRELASRLGVSPQYVTKFLNTPQNTSLYQVVRIAQAVGLRVDVMLTPQLAATKPAGARRSIQHTAEHSAT
jgi:transcriptional regulator with XRE-family HTH domain